MYKKRLCGVRACTVCGAEVKRRSWTAKFKEEACGIISWYLYKLIARRSFAPTYSRASPTTPTTPMTHDIAFACDALAGFAVVEAAAPLPDGLGLPPLVDVPLGLPEMFCWEIAIPVLLRQ
jgi:hypothetical protein